VDRAAEPRLVLDRTCCTPGTARIASSAGRVAIIATPTEQVMVAWVEATADGKHALKTRRYGVKMCQ